MGFLQLKNYLNVIFAQTYPQSNPCFHKINLLLKHPDHVKRAIRYRIFHKINLLLRLPDHVKRAIRYRIFHKINLLLKLPDHVKRAIRYRIFHIRYQIFHKE